MKSLQLMESRQAQLELQLMVQREEIERFNTEQSLLERVKLEQECQTSPRAQLIDSEIQTTWTGTCTHTI